MPLYGDQIADADDFLAMAEGYESEFAEGKGQHPKEQKDSEAFHHSCCISFRCL